MKHLTYEWLNCLKYVPIYLVFNMTGDFRKDCVCRIQWKSFQLQQTYCIQNDTLGESVMWTGPELEYLVCTHLISVTVIRNFTHVTILIINFEVFSEVLDYFLTLSAKLCGSERYNKSIMYCLTMQISIRGNNFCSVIISDVIIGISLKRFQFNTFHL